MKVRVNKMEEEMELEIKKKKKGKKILDKVVKKIGMSEVWLLGIK